MRYLLLLNNAAERGAEWHELTPEEAQMRREEVLPRWTALIEWMGEQGIEASETLVTDGPFLETKEVLGGYFLADCKDLDQAIELAQRVPLAGSGSVEIRPVVTH